MRGPYKVINALPNHRYELKLLAGAYGKTTYEAAQFLVPWKGEWTPDTCAAFFEDMTSDEEPSRTEPAPDPSCLSGLPRLFSDSEDDGPVGDDRISREAVLDATRRR